MKLLHLSLTHFMGWNKLALDLSQYSGVTAILGVIDGDSSHSNGAGKSSLVMAILYSLYGKQVTKTMDELIMQGKEAEGFKVVLTFEYADKIYEVTRKKKANAQQTIKFKCVTDDLPLSGEPEALLKMPLSIWSNTVFSAQGKLSGFVDQSPSARKDTLTEIFGMANYLALEAEARVKHTEAAGALSYALGDRDRLRAQLAGLELPAGEPAESNTELLKVSDSIQRAAVRIEALRADIAKGDASLARANSISASIAELSSEYSRHANKEVDTLRAYAEKRAALVKAGELARAKLVAPKWDVAALTAEHTVALEIRGKMDSYRLAIDTAKAALAKLESSKALKVYELSRLQKKLDAFSSLGSVCPTCGTSLDESHKQEHVLQFTKEKDLLNSEITSLTKDININCINLHNVEGELSELKVITDTIPTLERQLLTAKNAEVDMAYSEKVITDAGSQLADLDQRHSQDIIYLTEFKTEIASKLTALDIELAGFDDIARKKKELTGAVALALSSYENLVNTKESLVETVHRLEAAQREQAKAQLLLSAAEAKVRGLEDDKAVYNELVKAFGPAGIPTLMLENCLADLQTYLDDYMALLSDGRIKVTFKTTKVSASTGKTSETLAIMVSDINGERDILLYSGGEKVRVYLAIRLALARLMARKTGHKVQMLLIDEVADLDDAGLNSFVQLLKSVDAEFEQIFLVSHLSELKNAFAGALTLARDLHVNYVGGNCDN